MLCFTVRDRSVTTHCGALQVRLLPVTIRSSQYKLAVTTTRPSNTPLALVMVVGDANVNAFFRLGIGVNTALASMVFVSSALSARQYVMKHCDVSTHARNISVDCNSAWNILDMQTTELQRIASIMVQVCECAGGWLHGESIGAMRSGVVCCSGDHFVSSCFCIVSRCLCRRRLTACTARVTVIKSLAPMTQCTNASTAAWRKSRGPKTCSACVTKATYMLPGHDADILTVT